MKILITGANGQLGQKVAELLRCHYDLVLTDRDNMDITNDSKVRRIIKLEKPELIIHAAAYVDVDRAEKEKNECRKVNVSGSRNLAEAAESIGAAMIYFSTDYVFDGRQITPYTETDITSPISLYGKSKLDGETEIIKHCSKYYILRISWLFGESSQGKNFIETMKNLGRGNKLVRVVDDQVGSPTYTGDVAEVTKKIMERFEASKPIPWGIYHFSGSGETTKFGLTKEIFRQLKIKAKLSPISTKDYPTPAQRPAYSYLSKNKIEQILEIKARDWRDMLLEYLSITENRELNKKIT